MRYILVIWDTYLAQSESPGKKTLHPSGKQITGVHISFVFQQTIVHFDLGREIHPIQGSDGGEEWGDMVDSMLPMINNRGFQLFLLRYTKYAFKADEGLLDRVRTPAITCN